jgi:hypothetical protein
MRGVARRRLAPLACLGLLLILALMAGWGSAVPRATGAGGPVPPPLATPSGVTIRVAMAVDNVYRFSSREKR